MATTSPRRASGQSRGPSQARRSGGSRPAAKRTGKPAAQRGAKTVAKVAAKPAAPSKLARKAALKAAETLARRTLGSGVDMVRRTVELAGDRETGSITAGLRRRIPIQRAVDVAVPLAVAWREWMALKTLPEGVNRVRDIERDGGARLVGRTAGRGGAEWEAEILDERERQSFAWQSVRGSDVAGLVTFHQLSRRLTRVELSLDIVPTDARQALAVAGRVADHRAEVDLRRFKARLELINPDVYEKPETADR
jgi:uncharacterized membrane protein